MKEYIDDRGFCYFHPRQQVVGVCALCLNERLSVLAAKQQSNKSIRSSYNSQPKIFALTSFLNRLDIRHHKSSHDHQLQPYYDDSSPSPEDSFISIKFEGNGVASWDKDQISKMSLDHQCCSEMSMNGNIGMESKEIKSVVEHSKPRSTLRWRKRIGHVFQLIRWKRSSKGNVSHVGTKIGPKVKYGWIKALTKRKTNQD